MYGRTCFSCAWMKANKIQLLTASLYLTYTNYQIQVYYPFVDVHKRTRQRDKIFKRANCILQPLHGMARSERVSNGQVGKL